MASPSQVLANRANAQASTGPKTEQGKARSAANSANFGLFATRNTVAPEELAEHDALHTSLWNELQPATVMEEALASQILRALWRLRRCDLVESNLQASDTPDSDPEQIAVDRARAQANAIYRRSWDALSRMQTERQIRAEMGTSDHGIACQKDIMASRLLKRRLDGLHKFEAIVHHADAEIAKRSQRVPGSVPTGQPSTPRNAMCPCASGEKFKRCCGRGAPPALGKDPQAHAAGYGKGSARLMGARTNVDRL